MSEQPIPTDIKILDKEFRIACPEDEQDALLESARYLNARMKEVRETGKVVGIDRIAIMAALNLAHELLQYKHQLDNLDRDIGPKLLAMQKKVQSALNNTRQLEL